MVINKYEIIEALKKDKNKVSEQKFKIAYENVYQEVLKYKFPNEFVWSQKLYHYLYNDFELKLGICPICGKRCKYNKFSKGYFKHCSYNCSASDKNTKKKREDTNLKLYGSIQYSMLDECKEKVKNTNNDKFGCDYYSQTNEYKMRVIKTSQNKWGVNNYSQTDECKQRQKHTNLIKFGVEYATQSEVVKNKARETCNKLYGSDYYTQTNEFSKYRRKRIKYDDILFDSSWEVEVYKYCKENNIPCVYQPNIRFVYTHNEKKHYYQPDFLICDKLYEIKGTHFFEGGKMINPFDRTQDELYEAKHQCMINNNVVILKREEIKKIKNKINIFL